MTKEKTKETEKIAQDSEPLYVEDGLMIFRMMQEKYPKQTNEDLGKILSGCCAALVCMMYHTIHPSEHKNFVKMINVILSKSFLE